MAVQYLQNVQRDNPSAKSVWKVALAPCSPLQAPDGHLCLNIEAGL